MFYILVEISGVFVVTTVMKNSRQNLSYESKTNNLTDLPGELGKLVQFFYFGATILSFKKSIGHLLNFFNSTNKNHLLRFTYDVFQRK